MDARPDPPLDGLRLGESSEPLTVATPEDNRVATLAMLGQARRSVDLVSWRLDPPVYDDREVCEALRRMVLASSRARVRILILDARTPARRAHRLIHLARRLSSFFELRVPAPEHAELSEAFLLVDGVGVLARLEADRYEGTAWFAARRRARELGALFDEMWAVAVPDPELRELQL